MLIFPQLYHAVSASVIIENTCLKLARWLSMSVVSFLSYCWWFSWWFVFFATTLWNMIYEFQYSLTVLVRNDLCINFWRISYHVIFTAQSGNVSCSFRDQNTCGYTVGSCWDIALLSTDNYGKPATTLLMCLWHYCMFYLITLKVCIYLLCKMHY